MVSVGGSREVDLDTPEAVEEMVRRFYADVAQDDLLGPVFEDVAGVDWAEHVPKLVAFWSRMLLDIDGYRGNPLRRHREVHQRRAFTPAHFERWFELFADTLDSRWSGPRVERARTIARDVVRIHSGQLLGEPLDVG